MSGSVVGLFAGIGGFERGFADEGFQAKMLSEIDPHCRAVLRHRFPDAHLHHDLLTLHHLPPSDILVAGFPCQNYSQAGKLEATAGASGALLSKVFDLVRTAKSPPQCIVFENVSFILSARKGVAVRLVIDELESLGYSWSYRIIDVRAFGIPQRRRRWILVATRDQSCLNLLVPEAQTLSSDGPESYGFYWTEGNTGVGLARDAVPPLKGGSSYSIPSPPAVWVPSTGELFTPELRDAERLQGFSADWSLPAEELPNGRRIRWRLVGNAINVRMARWIAGRLSKSALYTASDFESFDLPGLEARLPNAAFNVSGQRRSLTLGELPDGPYKYVPLLKYLKFDHRPLSKRATSGFLSRARKSSLKFPEGFLEDLDAHIEMFAGALQ